MGGARHGGRVRRIRRDRCRAPRGSGRQLVDDQRANILLYHVVPGVFDSATVIAAAPIDALETLNPDGATLKVEVVDGAVVINESAEVIQADVVASNGVIHVIDAVLVPAA